MKFFQTFFVYFLAVFFTYTVLAQEFGSVRSSYELKIPQKIQKLVLDPLPAGTYTIGTGGDFPTIDSAFNKLSIDGIAGEVILELIDALYTSPSGVPYILNGPINGASASSRVTIRPAENVAVTIEGDGEAVLMFYDVSYLTLDGISPQGNTSLMVYANYNTQGTSWNDAIDFYGDCDYVQVQNLKAHSDDVVRAAVAIAFINVQSAIPDSCIISGVSVTSGTFGIYVIGHDSFRPSGFEIRNSHIGSPMDSLISWGIQNELSDGTIIENNVVENMRRGYYTYSQYFLYGINAYFSNNVIIRNNVVHNIRATENNTRSQGILISGDAAERGNNVWVYNNMIYDIAGYANANVGLAGIRAWDQDNLRIEYNSISLTELGDIAPSTGSAALWFQSSNYSPSAFNNILVNTRNDSPYTSTAIRFDGNSGSSDFNDLYVESFDNSYIGMYAGTFYNTLSNWQSTGKDLDGISEMPNFVDPYLHIDETFATNLERGATSISGITTDFDGDARNASTPDIGADEFDGYRIDDPLPAGIYTVGTGGNFTTIQDAFNKLGTDGVAGNVTLELIDDLYTAPTDSFGFHLDGPIPGAGPDSRITIKPAENKNVVIEGDGRNTLSLWNTSYFTFDGIATEGSTTLTIHHLYNATFDLNRGITFANNSDHNIVRNLILIGEDLYRYGDAINFITTLNSTLATDSNTVESNFVKKGAGCVTIGAYYAATNVRPTGNIIRNNKFGSETDSLYSWGIQLERCKNTIVENNIIQNQKVTTTYGNDIINVGINSFWGEGDIIRNNIVHNIKSTNGYTCTGILLSCGNGNYGNNNMVYNNMVYDIQSTSSQSKSRVAGIELWCQNNPMIYYNSVYLSGSGANQQGSAAFYIYGGFGGSSGVDVKNNIFVNTRDESPYCASAIYDFNIPYLLSDYNDLYYDDSNPNNCLVRIGNTNYNTLSDWQAAGKDSNSVSEMPNFISPYLHINGSIATLLDNGATPISEIETDFDGQTRNATTPDIGADEFTIVGVQEEEILPTEYSLIQNYPNPFNPSTKIKYSIPQTSQVQIKVFDVLGNEIETLVNEEKPAGTYELNWNAASLPSGVYFYQLRAGSFVKTKKMVLMK